MKTIRMADIKNAIKDKRFRNLFPEHKEEFEEYNANPDCSCAKTLLKALSKKKKRLSQYFSKVKNLQAKPEPKEFNWVVINCGVNEIKEKLSDLKIKKLAAFARYKDQITAVLCDTLVLNLDEQEVALQNDNQSKLMWEVINTDTEGLIGELNKLKFNKITIQLCRYENDVTIIIRNVN
mgnify:CR=1 FL=1